MDKEALDKTLAEFVGVFKEIAKGAIEDYERHRNKHTGDSIINVESAKNAEITIYDLQTGKITTRPYPTQNTEEPNARLTKGGGGGC